jgi:hypothetical protein
VSSFPQDSRDVIINRNGSEFGAMLVRKKLAFMGDEK